jgi:hypothetical protein
LKTKTDKYKKYWAILMGNEIYCYKSKNDSNHRIMHSLVGTFIKDQPEECSPSSKCKLYPVKILLPPAKSRILYFGTESDQ